MNIPEKHRLLFRNTYESLRGRIRRAGILCVRRTLTRRNKMKRPLLQNLCSRGFVILLQVFILCREERALVIFRQSASPSCSAKLN